MIQTADSQTPRHCRCQYSNQTKTICVWTQNLYDCAYYDIHQNFWTGIQRGVTLFFFFTKYGGGEVTGAILLEITSFFL